MAAPPRRIFLVGLSGSGKTTAGRIAAERLGWAFVDTDREIETTVGREIADVFENDGEDSFRAAEAHAVATAAVDDEVVVSTGGGALTHEPSRRVIAGGIAIWLDASPERAAERLANDSKTETRPLLQGDLRGRLQQLFWEREALYRRADFTIDVDGRSPEETADAIVACWERALAGHAPDVTFSPDRLETL